MSITRLQELRYRVVPMARYSIVLYCVQCSASSYVDVDEVVEVIVVVVAVVDVFVDVVVVAVVCCCCCCCC